MGASSSTVAVAMRQGAAVLRDLGHAVAADETQKHDAPGHDPPLHRQALTRLRRAGSALALPFAWKEQARTIAAESAPLWKPGTRGRRPRK